MSDPQPAPVFTPEQEARIVALIRTAAVQPQRSRHIQIGRSPMPPSFRRLFERLSKVGIAVGVNQPGVEQE